MTIRPLLHPVTAAVVLGALGALGTVLVAAAGRGPAAGALLLLVVAGAAAGFANSGST